MIGFIDTPTPYTASEQDDVFTVTIGVLFGILTEEVILDLSFADGTASGEPQNREGICVAHNLPSSFSRSRLQF